MGETAVKAARRCLAARRPIAGPTPVTRCPIAVAIVVCAALPARAADVTITAAPLDGLRWPRAKD